ncbi:MAG: hypothetical protein [Caudoviricetes sp.]|nr:MAG: hypothetical protein [Caudoviricetes sp.]
MERITPPMNRIALVTMIRVFRCWLNRQRLRDCFGELFVALLLGVHERLVVRLQECCTVDASCIQHGIAQTFLVTRLFVEALA